MQAFEIGTVVYVSLYNKGRGVVYAINGNQAPETIVNYGIGTGGGNATINIVFEDGTAFTDTPECIAHGYARLDEIATDIEIIDLLNNLHLQTRLRDEQAKADKLKFNAMVDEVKNSPLYAHLKVGNKPAQNIRADLKKHFPGVKFSVTSDYSSVNVHWTDGPKAELVDELLAKYEQGKFDGMEDYYKSIKTPFNTVFADVKYIFTSRTLSDETLAKLIVLANEQCGTSYSIADYHNGVTFYNDYFRRALQKFS